MTLAIRLAFEKAISLGVPLAGITIDLKKAFDSVVHSRLFGKLRKSPLPPQYVRCVSMLIERHRNLLPDGKAIPIDCGVPQGSILSPKKFLV